MDDDDVEMEFVSVMGVLVPVEVTKGLSNEAKRFAAGGVTSDDEGHEEVDGPIPDTNLNQAHSERSESKCDHNNPATTRSEYTEYTHPTTAEAESESLKFAGISTVEEKCVDHDESVAAVNAPVTSVAGEVEAETKTLEEKAATSQATKQTQVKNDKGLQTAEQTQKTRAKKRRRKEGQGQESKKRRGKVQPDEAKERSLSGECNVANVKKPKKKLTKVEAKGNPSSPFDGTKRSTTSLKSETQSVKTKAAGAQPRTILNSTSESKKKTTAANSSASAAFSPSASVVISKAKRRVKRPRIAEDEANTKSEQRKSVSATSEVCGARDLKSADGAQGKKSKTSKPTRPVPDPYNLSDLTKASGKASTPSERGHCAYPGCAESARYKSRCEAHYIRARCSVPDCFKFAHSGGKCIAHGGGARCTEDGCKSRARSKGKCYTHGGGMVCSHPECTTRAKTKGKCVAHGGGTLCSMAGCDKLVISDGRCIAHGGWIKCSHPGCTSRVHLRRKCIDHGKLDTATEGTDTDKGPEKTAIQSAEKTMEQPRCSLENSTAKPLHFTKCTAKSNGTKKSQGATSKRLKNGTTDATEAKSVKFKRRRKFPVVARAAVDQEAMSLRSGQRIARITNNRYGFQSEEEALQMALKLSEIEY